MKCFNCGEIARNEDIFCNNCGTKLNHQVCEKCGNTLEANDKFCDKCGTKVEVSNSTPVVEKIKSYSKAQGFLHKHKKLVVSSLSVVLVLVVIFVSVSCYIANKPSNKIIGEWSTERGLDSHYLTFKSNGTLIERPDMFTTYEYIYFVTGSKLFIRKDNTYESIDNTQTYYYSKNAMYDASDCWYMESDVLYFNKRTYYRQ